MQLKYSVFTVIVYSLHKKTSTTDSKEFFCFSVNDHIDKGNAYRRTVLKTDPIKASNVC